MVARRRANPKVWIHAGIGTALACWGGTGAWSGLSPHSMFLLAVAATFEFYKAQMVEVVLQP